MKLKYELILRAPHPVLSFPKRHHSNKFLRILIEKYGDATDQNMIPVEMGQSNEIIDENATNETDSEKLLSPKVFAELQPLREGNATDQKMIPVEMRQSNAIIDEIATNVTNSKKPVSPKVFTEIQLLCEGNAIDRKMIPVKMRQSNEIIDENATNETDCEKPVLPKVFTELQPLREEYMEDSPVDDSDVDQDYEPSDEEQKNTKKLTFLAQKRKISNKWFESRKSAMVAEHLRIVKAAAAIVRERIRWLMYDVKKYPSTESIMDEVVLPETLSKFVNSLLPKNTFDYKSIPLQDC
ncbi:unnamed protein product [Psylliodes chrysocephalus]|uniref:Uncharacterized protein n=1 Tax=Psylliodes chrysocephalus TaxID=3402493 RepID=A0A9P0D7K1_9CUCU|nr:unnamed protein product [Psylliodes chrysocephala]